MAAPPNPKNVIIAGGSLAGLMSGVMLKRLGHNVRIFEMRPQLLNDEGAGIVFGNESQQYFRKFVKANRDPWVTSVVRQTLDRNGGKLHEEKYPQKMVSWDLLYYLLRANFDGLESGYCEVPGKEEGEGDAVYDYGHTVVSLREEGNGVEVTYQERDGSRKTATADMVIGADGASSTIRKIFLPEIKRKYAGYVAWRGTLEERDVSQDVRDTFVDHFTFHHGPGIQILSYLIPGENGALELGTRLINWVWYNNYPEGSKGYEELMTDIDGNRHQFTVPVGKIKPELCRRQSESAGRVLAPQFAKLVQGTKHPFVQAITDVMTSKTLFMNGKVMLVGDAVAGFRPHTAASTSQGAFHALLIESCLKGDISGGEMQDIMLDHARQVSQAGIRMGNRSQFASLKGQSESSPNIAYPELHYGIFHEI